MNHQQWYKDSCNYFLCKEGSVEVVYFCTTTTTQSTSTTTRDPSAGSCTFENEVYQNGQIWYLDQCIGYSCYMGVVHQFNNCHSTTKSPSYPTQSTPPPQKPCWFQGIEYHSGARWNKDQCHTYICNDGEIGFFNHCPETQTTSAPPIGCNTPTGQFYYHGQIWKTGTCLQHTCISGEVTTSDVCTGGGYGVSSTRSCWMCDAHSYEECLQIGMRQTCPGDSVCFLEVRSRGGHMERMCTGCQQREACQGNKLNNQDQCFMHGYNANGSPDSVCRDCCSSSDCSLEINMNHPMIAAFPPLHTNSYSSGKSCDAIYTPDEKHHSHGETWGAGICPHDSTTPLYEWTCLDGKVHFTDPCKVSYSQPGSECVNGAPHNAGYNIGTCSITGGPLATWKCSNGQLTYENPCYEAFLSSQSTYSSGSSSQYYQTYGSNNNNPSNSEEERLILAVDSSFGVYLMNGAYLSAEQHSFAEQYLFEEMARFGHASWVENGFPDDPITSVDYYNRINFEDGSSLTQNEHNMSGEEISLLRDLLK